MGDLGRNVSDFLSDDMHHRESPELADHVEVTRDFIQSTVIPAFEEVKARLEQEGREVRITNHQTTARMDVFADGRAEFSYAIRTQLSEAGAAPHYETTGAYGGSSPAGNGSMQAQGQDQPIAHAADVSREELVRQILAAYEAERARH